MKQGMKLDTLAQELKRQLESKKDLKAPTSCLEVATVRDAGQDLVETRKASLKLRVEGQGSYFMTSHFHDQLGTWANIPSKYYDRMQQEAPDLLAANLNHWLRQAKDDKTGAAPTRLVRTIDGQARAFLSNRYRTIDNFDLAEAALPTMMKAGCEIQSANVDYNRLHLKVATPRLTAEVKKGDVVQLGVSLSNSEVGLGAAAIEPFVFRLACLNGMVIPDASLRRFHIGRIAEDLEHAVEFFRDETRQADDRAFMMKVRDVLEGSFQEARFTAVLEQMSLSAKAEIEAPVAKVVEEVKRSYRLSDAQGDSILQHLAAGGDLTQWGLANAVTRAATDQATYDEATRLERLGGELVMLPKKEWQGLAA